MGRPLAASMGDSLAMISRNRAAAVPMMLFVASCSVATPYASPIARSVPSTTPVPASATMPRTATRLPSLIDGCVLAPSLRVRSGPGAQYSLVGGLAQGECRQFDGRSADGGWVRAVSTEWEQGHYGWVALEFVHLQGSAMSLPVRTPDPTPRPLRPSPTITRHPTATEGPVAPQSQSGGGSCHPSYVGVCIPIGSADYDCAGGSGNGPNYVQGPFGVRWDVADPDPYGLDRDGDGVGCE